MHAKDVSVDRPERRENGMITGIDFPRPLDRPFNFRTVGFGHSLQYWRDIFAELRKQGYDYVVSIEMECELFDAQYGVRYAIDFLESAILSDSIAIKDKWLDLVAEPTDEMRELYCG
jgi:sugar phosphate isomerase/epimerase